MEGRFLSNKVGDYFIELVDHFNLQCVDFALSFARSLISSVNSVDSRMCPAVILILSPLGTQTWIEEQDSEERGKSNVSGLCNRLIQSQKYKTKSTWCGPLPRSDKTLATLVLSIQEGNF